MAKKLSKTQKIALKIVREQVGDREVSFEEFGSLYLGALAFVYVDTYGVPKRIVFEEIEKWSKSV